ncbi:hypothetical protein DCS_07139 [Drechmeria coniospora]|uniref:Methyltransferase domain-containing protein n=1 Tax=Drechmeria coniospora TaxID=98403 RepID=A0A151GDK2_DRECN|nr:hypothetical protein DCS_07139 [Drechmeria coniospora]KYK55177.1 hypothetical protein DCS_07139 [Drechmeria coniospora]
MPSALTSPRAGERGNPIDIMTVQQWAYVSDLPDDIAPMRDLLRSYSKIPAADIDHHIMRVRQDAWSISRYPFVGRWKFLRLADSQDPCHQQVVFRLLVAGSRDVFLDLGCCVGQILRQLRAAGVRGSQLIGTDVQPKFIDIGYDLFRDRKTLGALFVAGDILDPEDTRIDALRGRVTIIYAGSFFHLFSRVQQLYIGKRLVSFIKPGTKNALIYGRQVGTTNPGKPLTNTMSAFLHDKGSFQRLWDEIGFLTRTRWKVEMEATHDFAHSPPSFAVGSSQAVSFMVYQIS